jgi:long-chain acyl-CoA synthetase
MDAPVNLSLLEQQRVERRGDEPSVFFADRWTGSAARLAAGMRIAAVLRGAGVRAGDRVLVLSSNRPEVLETLSAIWRLGAVAVPMTTGSRAAEVQRVVDATQPRVLVADGSGRDATQPVSAEHGLPRLCFDGGQEVVDLSACAATADGIESPVDSTADDLAAILFTGGTTGRSKGVMLTHGNLWWAGRSRMQLWSDDPAECSLMPLPLSHVYGLLLHVCDLHWPGPRRQVLMRRFSLPDTIAAIEQHAVEETTLVPAAIEALLASQEEPERLRSLRYLASGSSALSTISQDEFRQRFPWVDLRLGYGMTEATGLISGTPRFGWRRGSVGRPVPGCEVRIVDEVGADVGTSRRGEIVCRSPFVTPGYWPAPGEEPAVMPVTQEWLRTGDLGHLDEDGYLFITGRLKDVIIRGGFNVYPHDVEAALTELPGITAAAVVGCPDPVRGEEVVAFYIATEGCAVAADEVEAFARGRVAGYKRPSLFVPVGAFPLTRLGKLDRKALSRRAGELIAAGDSGDDGATG